MPVRVPVSIVEKCKHRAHRGTEHTEKRKRELFFLCVLCLCVLCVNLPIKSTRIRGGAELAPA
jgi:hypothetical protein